jgi:hypothetical protein
MPDKTDRNSQPDDQPPARRDQPDTGEYSATKAPENREHVESREPTADPRATPGGELGVKVDVGMSGLHSDTVPGIADSEESDG